MAINGEAAGEELIASVNGVVYPLSGEECVFRASSDGGRHVMTVQVLRALDICTRFRGFDEHVAAVMNGIGELKGQEEAVRHVLSTLQKRGLFTTAEESLSQLGREETQPTALAGVMVRSAGRADCLDRLLQSLDEVNRRYQEDYPCYVFNDASDPDAAEACKAACEGWRDRGLAVHWLGSRWQSAFVEDLAARAGAGGDEVRWLLDPAFGHEGFTGGRVWNQILLAGAGRRMLFMDDDLVLSPRHMGQQDGIAFGTTQWDVWFHAGAEQAGAAGTEMDADPVAAHAAYLGHGLGPALRGCVRHPAELHGLDQRELQGIDGTAPVLTTVSGTYGDAATGQPLWLYTLSGESRERFRGDRESYERNTRLRWMTRVRNRVTVQRRTQFSPGGLDGGHLLPPTMPFGRTEDMLFHVLLHRTHPRSRSLELPWALGHFPGDQRQWTPGQLDEPMSSNLATFVSDSLLNLPEPLPWSDPALLLREASNQVRYLAELADGPLKTRLDEYLMYIRSDLVARLQQQLRDEPKAPIYWAADVRRIVEANGKALTGEDFPRLGETPDGMGETDYLAWVRGHMGRLAESLGLWPALHEAARELDPLPK